MILTDLDRADLVVRKLCFGDASGRREPSAFDLFWLNYQQNNFDLAKQSGSSSSILFLQIKCPNCPPMRGGCSNNWFNVYCFQELKSIRKSLYPERLPPSKFKLQPRSDQGFKLEIGFNFVKHHVLIHNILIINIYYNHYVLKGTFT